MSKTSELNFVSFKLMARKLMGGCACVGREGVHALKSCAMLETHSPLVRSKLR